MSAQGIEDRGHRPQWLESCCSEISTAQYIYFSLVYYESIKRELIYNIEKWGCLKARIIQRKPTLLNVPWYFLFPPPPPQKKTSTTYPKRLPIKTSSSPMRCPRDRFPEQTPSTNELRGPRRGFVPGDHALAPSRTRIQALLPSRGHNDQAFPTPNATRRVPAQWARTTRPPDPVRGPTTPSTPRSPHWRQEAYPKTGFRKAMKVFF